MKLLQGGAPKCGNFWLYQIIQRILTETGQPTGSFIQRQPIYELAKTWDLNYPSQASIDVLDVTDLQYSYRISSIFRMPVQSIRAYIQQADHIWTHSPICQRSPELLDLVDKKVYIVRDPRDRAISAAKYYTSAYMLKYYPQEERDPQRFLEKHFEQLLLEWVWHVYDHLRLSQRHHIHIAFYEGFLLDFQEELGRLLDYLGLELNPAQREALEEAVSFDTLKAQNPKHLKKGQSGYWMDQLTEAQTATAEMLAGPLLRFLGYPTAKGQFMTYATTWPHHDFEQLRQEIIASQQPLYQQ